MTPAGDIHDPVVGLPVTLHPDDLCPQSARPAFLTNLFQLQKGFPLVLFFATVTRKTHRGRSLRRAMAVTRRGILIMYTKKDKASSAARYVPHAAIRGVVLHTKESPPTLAIRAVENDVPFDLVLQLCDPRRYENLLSVLNKCITAAQRMAQESQWERNIKWTQAAPPYALKKPKGWSFNLPTDAIPVLSWREAFPPAPRERTPPRPLPPPPPLPHESPAARLSPQSSHLAEAQQPLSQRVQLDKSCWEQLESIRMQSHKLAEQQDLHLAMLHSAQRMVNYLSTADTKTALNQDDPPPPPPPEHINIPPPSPPPPPPPPPIPEDDMVHKLEEEVHRIQRELDKDNEYQALQVEQLQKMLRQLAKETPPPSSASSCSEDGQEEPATSESTPSLSPANSAADSSTQRLVEKQAQSIQSRRRQIEEILIQLRTLEEGGREGAEIEDLRRQLRGMMQDLELEAMTYELGLTMGIPSAQAASPLASLGGGVEGITDAHPSPSTSPAKARSPSLKPPTSSPQAKQAALPPPTADYNQWASYYYYYVLPYYQSAYLQQQQQQQQQPQKPPSGFDYGSTASQYTSSSSDLGTPWDQWRSAASARRARRARQ